MDEALQNTSSSRVDAFVDAAFAFAITLLVVSGDALPRTLDDLLAAVAQIPAFAAGFALLALFWWSHHSYRKLHRTDDAPGLLLSLIIVFVVMIYVYPLRLLGESTAFYLSGRTLPGSPIVQSPGDMKALYLIYGVGFVALALLYVLLFRHARRQSERSEIADEARISEACWMIAGGVGLASILLAVLLPTGPWAAGLPGMVYMLIPVGVMIYMRTRGRRLATQATPTA